METIRNELRQWLMQKHGVTDASAIGFDTPLLEQGLLRSIDIADLLIYIEFLRERPVDIRELQPAAFATINTLATTFFAEERA